MKKIICKIALLTAVVFGAVACSDWLDDVDESQNRYISLGELEPTTRTIKGDYGEVLNIVEVANSAAGELEKENKRRVCFNYSVLKRNADAQNSMNIRINEFYPLVVDDVESLSLLDEDARAELGKTPVSPIQAAISGGYINVQMAYVTMDAEGVDFEFELVYDDSEGASTDNTLVLQITHKGKDVSKQPSDNSSYSYQWASFKLSNELLERYGHKTTHDLMVVFRYKWWNNAGEIVDNVANLAPAPYSL